MGRYRPGIGEGGQRDLSIGPLVVPTAILKRENLEMREVTHFSSRHSLVCGIKR